MRQPWRRPKLVSRTNSVGKLLFSMITPSPRPSTRRAPHSVPPRMMMSSLWSPSSSRWCRTAASTSLAARSSKNFLETWTLLSESRTLRNTHTAPACLRSLTSSSVSAPVHARAKSLMPSGRRPLAAPPAALNSSMDTMATAPLTAFFLSSERGAKSPTSPSWSLLSASIVWASEGSGSSFMMIESEVAMSLKGRPRTNLQPSSLYRRSGFSKSLRSTTVMTLPSRCRALLTS
mmetsp:Transcript_2869/g.7818  ORF Transcript_2869/g.7818 Transcript_2869/m.7818 type:complete len:233 (-) Transcript_2869:1273-1971(-)